MYTGQQCKLSLFSLIRYYARLACNKMRDHVVHGHDLRGHDSRGHEALPEEARSKRTKLIEYVLMQNRKHWYGRKTHDWDAYTCHRLSCA